MNILQFNVRLMEDGAAGVVLDLHQHALRQELTSHFVCGYGKGGRESVSHQGCPQVIRYTPRMTATANITLSRLFNRDLSGNFNELHRTITRTPGPVVLHFHALRSYWLNLKSVVRSCERVEDHKPDVTLVWTLRDHQGVTGRRALTDGYKSWKTDCQECPTLNNYPPVRIDRAHQPMMGERQLFREMLTLDCQFIPPSQHAADALNSLYGPGRCRIINGGIDMVTEAILADLPSVHETRGRSKIAATVHDPRYNGRANQQLVREMVASSDKIKLHTFGKFSPSITGNVINHSFEVDKHKLVSVLNQMNALVFSSRIDNYPLISCEALPIGVPVIITHNDATREVLQKPGGKIASEEDVLQLAQLSKPEIAQAIFGATLAEFSQRDRAACSGRQMPEEYVSFYQNL